MVAVRTAGTNTVGDLDKSARAAADKADHEVIAEVEAVWQTWTTAVGELGGSAAQHQEALVAAIDAANVGGALEAEDAATWKALARRHRPSPSERLVIDRFEAVDDAFASTVTALRDAIYYRRGGSRAPVPSTFQLLPQPLLLPDGTEVGRLTPGVVYPEGLDRITVLEALEPLKDLRDELAIVLDFDGTLAELKDGDTPEDSRALPPTNATIAAVCPRVKLLAIVSARDPLELTRPDRIDGSLLQRFSNLRIYGNDGLSQLMRGGTVAYPTLTEEDRAAIDETRALLTELVEKNHLPLRVQDKGITFEVMTSRLTHSASEEEFAAELGRFAPALTTISEATGLTLKQKKTYWNFRPVGPDKGTIFTGLVAEAGAGMAAGDAENDQSMFDAVEALNATGKPAVGVLSHSLWTPEKMKGTTTLDVPGPPGVIAVLQEVGLLPDGPGRR